MNISVYPVIVTCLNERPVISRMLFMCAERLGIDVVASVHCQSDKELVAHYGHFAVMNEANYPGQKWNNALRYAMSKHYTHFLIMGDDDSLSNDGFNLLIEAAVQGKHHIGFDACGFYDTLKTRSMIFQYTTEAYRLIGAGRLISRTAVDAAVNQKRIIVQRSLPKFQIQAGEVIDKPAVISDYLVGIGVARHSSESPGYLWPELVKSGLDGHSELKLVIAGYAPEYVGDNRVHVCDFKSSRNIWKYGDLRSHGRECDSREITDIA